MTYSSKEGLWDISTDVDGNPICSECGNLLENTNIKSAETGNAYCSYEIEDHDC